MAEEYGVTKLVLINIIVVLIKKRPLDDGERN